LSAAAVFSQFFSGVNGTSNQIFSTINSASIVTTVKNDIGSVLTTSVQPTGSSGFGSSADSITSQSRLLNF